MQARSANALLVMLYSLFQTHRRRLLQASLPMARGQDMQRIPVATVTQTRIRSMLKSKSLVRNAARHFCIPRNSRVRAGSVKVVATSSPFRMAITPPNKKRKPSPFNVRSASFYSKANRRWKVAKASAPSVKVSLQLKGSIRKNRKMHRSKNHRDQSQNQESSRHLPQQSRLQSRPPFLPSQPRRGLLQFQWQFQQRSLSRSRKTPLAKISTNRVTRLRGMLSISVKRPHHFSRQRNRTLPIR